MKRGAFFERTTIPKPEAATFSFSYQGLDGKSGKGIGSALRFRLRGVRATSWDELSGRSALKVGVLFLSSMTLRSLPPFWLV